MITSIKIEGKLIIPVKQISKVEKVHVRRTMLSIFKQWNREHVEQQLAIRELYER